MNELQMHIVGQTYTDADALISVLEDTIAAFESGQWEDAQTKTHVALEKSRNLANLIHILKNSANGTPKEGPYR